MIDDGSCFEDAYVFLKIDFFIRDCKAVAEYFPLLSYLLGSELVATENQGAVGIAGFFVHILDEIDSCLFILDFIIFFILPSSHVGDEFKVDSFPFE